MAPLPPSTPPALPSATSRWQRLWRSVPRAAVGNLAAKLAMVSLGLAITVLVARQGPAVQGAFALFVACESALLTLFSGLGLWLARQVSRQQGDSEQAQALWPRLRQVLRAGVGLGLMASVVLAALAWGFDRPPFSSLWVLALAAPFLLLVPTATGLWLGQGRMWPLNLAQVAAPGAVLAGLGLLFFLRDENRPLAPTVLLVLLAWVTGKSLVAVLTAWRARSDALGHDQALTPSPTGVDVQGAGWRQDWRFVAVIGLTNVVSLMNFRISLFLVEHFRGLAEAGTYSVAVTVAELLWLLSSSVTVAVYARIGHPDRDSAAATTVQAVRINLMVTVLAAPVLLLGAHWALPWALGAPYQASVLPLALLLPGVAAYAAASSLSAFYTNHLGRPHLSGLVASFSLLISAGVGFMLVPSLGAVGAAVATSLGYGLAIVLALVVFLRLAGLPGSVLWRGAPLPPG